MQLLSEKMRLLGEDHIRKERFATLLTKMGVPQVISGDVSQVLPVPATEPGTGVIATASGQQPEIDPPADPEVPDGN